MNGWMNKCKTFVLISKLHPTKCPKKEKKWMESMHLMSRWMNKCTQNMDTDGGPVDDSKPKWMRISRA
jgi:hypothetical protein